MAATKDRPRARFAPIPIETTFERYRTAIPAGEPTPSPSPRSPSPPPREKRRFAPQLVESSVRRSRRAGDEGPATKPTDRTDITPYTNHIYAPKTRKRLGHGGIPGTPSRQKGHARRESCDDEIAGGVFDLVARDAQRKLQEVAMSAFPNSGQRIGGAEHFYVREGSDDDGPRGRPLTRGPWNHLQSRRNSSEEDISWAFKEMQEHVQMLSRDRSRVDTLDLDNMSIDGPPSDAMGLTRTQRTSIASSPIWTSSRPSSGSLGPIGETQMPLLRAESPLPTIGESVMPYIPPESPPVRAIGESHMPYIPSAPPGKAGQMPYAPASQIPPETSFRHHAPFTPYGQERDMSLERARQQHRLRLKSSPPMLGQDLKFRMCPSPKQTKLEPDHLWDLRTGTTVDEHNRDPTEQHGLWRGYCYTSDGAENLIPAERPAMLTTPSPPTSLKDPFARDFGLSAPIALSEEPTPDEDMQRTGTQSVPQQANGLVPHPEHRTRSQVPKGLHMLQNLQNLEEKLKKEKAAADLEEKIAAEFNDKFVTQVYNYLSLGYPAMARQYDEELSKISRISVDELEKDDCVIMESLCGDDERGRLANGQKIRATGHIMLDSEEKDGVQEDDRCPRWKALKRYIYEWARQHPDLNAISPLAWGVQERRGSWGL
ncbi:LisH domain-containing protein [Madurella fahalii]|uniref:LisH domain-containing protein n=1 Tax=Madurella fahalii TaxID=1157608 RepID=A0ABQ0G4K2_9PEZI